MALGSLKPDDLAHHSRGVKDPPGFDPSLLIISNYEAIIQGPLFRGKINNTNYGTLFEICWWNALITYGVPPQLIDTHIDLSKGKHAEIDLLVHTAMSEDIALLLKTSLRERWKQPDRDAHVIRMFDQGRIKPWLVFYREHASDTAVRMISYAQRVERRCISGTPVRTVLDTTAMRALFLRCGATVTNKLSVTPEGALL
jgi:hypothetical protein